MQYSEKLKDPRWQKKRLEILNRDEFTCRYCGDKETTLHVHHLVYCGDPWEIESDKLITLCEHCHAIAETLKKEEPGFLVLNIEKTKRPGLENYSLIVFATSVTGEPYEGVIVYDIDSEGDVLPIVSIRRNTLKHLSEKLESLLNYSNAVDA